PKLADFFPLPRSSVAYRFAEEFEEGGGEEGVAEFEGVAPGTAQPVRLLQLSRYPLLLGQTGQRHDALSENGRVETIHDRSASASAELVGNEPTVERMTKVRRMHANRVEPHPKQV